MADPVLLLPEGASPPKGAEHVRVVALGPVRQTLNHDLRNPLGVILGNVELLREEVFGPVSERQAAALSTIEQQAERIRVRLEALADDLDGRSGA